MRSKFDGGKDSRRPIRTTDNSQRGSFFRSESHQDSHQQHGKDTQLCGCTENRKTQVTQHRSEVRQRTDTHEDDRRQETCLNQHIVNKVHDAEFVGNVMQRHFPDVLHHSVHHNHTILISLNHTHISSGEVGKQHTESDRHKQQRFILFLNSEIEQDERDGIHYQELRFGNDIAERSHVI